jgi:DNA polymerase III subunit gamma/tau
MSYVVLARKWRPMTFEDLVGQEHVSRTLHNAIGSGRVAHAFLFTGVRGVGKTTAARILAKALNCVGPPDDPATGPRARPCLVCAACREITTGADVDVREIDGASYNGVDEVRKLQDSLPYRPNRDRYKIFIVDEVHMLSQSAWNAFLKTLEEPPPHVKFIFATTEVHKVPVTILSRVQRFDFKLIPTPLIAGRLRHVLDTEGIAADNDALSVIAREAAGSMRDAMSLLDQVIAWNDQSLDGEGVARVLGVASRQVLHDLTRSVVKGDAAACLGIVSDLANQGFDMSTVARDVLALLRDLVVSKVCEHPGELLDLADEERRDVAALANETDTDDLVRLHQGFSKSYDEVVRSGQPRAALEMLLVRLARRPALLPIDDLVARLGALERRLGATGGGRGGPPSPAGTTGSGRGAASRDTRSQERRTPSRTAPEARPAPPMEAAETLAADPPAPPPVATRAGVPSPPPRPGAEQPPPPEGRVGAGPHGAEPRRNGSSLHQDGFDRWRELVARLAADRPEIAAYLAHATPLELDEARLVVGVEQNSVFEEHALSRETHGALAQTAERLFGRPVALRFERVAKVGPTISSIQDRERTEQRKLAVERAKAHPFVRELESVLGARLKEVRLPEE